MRTYVDPNVKLIDGTVSDLSFYTWLKSREHVIKFEDGTPIKGVYLDGVTSDGLYFDEDFYNIIFKYDESDRGMRLLVTKEDYKISEKASKDTRIHPSMRPNPKHHIYQFYVDNELVEVGEYRKRIMKMNLQYSNFDQYVFEITGSALFRDILYNINWNAQWARSERFRVSTLDLDTRLKEDSYPISSEYRGIPEWENQFTKYMEVINHSVKTDEVRLEMPYSISSVYWVSINRKTLINLASMIWLKMPFFFNIYMVPMLIEAKISHSELKDYVDSYLGIYFNDQDNWSEGSTYNSGFYTINSKMGLIMFSQFLRQGATTISGFYNELVHKDPIEFSHKVFKGNTIFNITYNAHKDRVMNTVSNRLCAFAMSSGDDPCSWSYFLNNFISDQITLDQFREMLPCKFGKDGRVCECKFYSDIQFRNSGTEISNDPCPLFNNSIELAERKKNTDHNKIGNLYYELTFSIVNNE